MAKNPPNRIGDFPAASAPPASTHPWVGRAAAALAAERSRFPLWLPPFLGLGIGIYFALPTEPSPAWGVGVALVAGVGCAGLRGRSLGWFLICAAVLAVALGFAAAQWRTVRLAAPVIERPTGALMVEGNAVEVEALPEGGSRVTLEHLVFDRDDVLVPARIRVKARPGLWSAAVGDRVRLRAMLMPPPQPAMPGAFDFARFAWYRQLGAIGTQLKPAEVIVPGSSSGLTAWINEIRRSLTARIMAVLPGDRGAVSAALISGDQMPISAPMMQAYRDSGLAHILSISGLHITMAAGLIFVGLRGLLALFPAVALRYPIKKWAAAPAVLFAGFYTLLAGMPVPAQRSFLMTGLVLVAVLLDRVALSMRLVAWAAAAILLVEPDELIGPSFQMSFAAVVALIAAYEVAAPRLSAWKAEHPGLLSGAGLYVFGVILSTLVAGFATAVYGIHHFNRFAVWSVAANMLAVPLTGFWVMPWALVMFLLLPFGLEAFALVPMGWGVEGVNLIAEVVASWPHSAVTLPVLPVWAMVVFSLGGCWLCLWRGRLRLWGLAPMLAALASMGFGRPPDLLVDGRGEGMAVRTEAGELLLNGKGGRILRETWTRRAGPPASERWPKRSSSRDGRLRCDETGCLWRVDGRVVALVRDEDEPEKACAGADVVIGSVPLRGTCRGARVVIDRFDLWRRGPHALWLEPGGGVRIESVAGHQGDRPWSWRPHPRRKIAPAPPRPEAEEKGDED